MYIHKHTHTHNLMKPTGNETMEGIRKISSNCGVVIMTKGKVLKEDRKMPSIGRDRAYDL